MEAVLTGRVMRRGDRLNVQADLIDVARAAQVWGRQYDRPLGDILGLQEEIVREVSRRLRTPPDGDAQPLHKKRSTENAEAYRLYLKGRYYWNRRTGNLLEKANRYFQQAIEMDPRYGLAHAALAESFALFSYYGVLSPAEAYAKAEAAARTAIGIDEAEAGAHVARGYIKMSYEWDWAGSELEFRRALDIEPNDGTARQWYAAYLTAVGRIGDALVEYKRALDAEPLSLIITVSVGHGYYFARQYDRAFEELTAAVEMDPGFVEARLRRGWVYELKGMYVEAVAELRQALSVSGRDPRMIGALGHAYALAGQRSMAEQCLLQLEEESRDRYVSPYDMAAVHIGLGDPARALACLEKACEDRSFWMIWLRVDPRFDEIRSERRYAALLRRMRLAE